MMESFLSTILLVEDEPLIAMQEKRMLERNGYSVTVCPSGEQALELVENRHRAEIILMDIDLGDGLDGTETAARILQEHDLPLIFVSSHTEPEVVAKTEGITSYGYIVKNSGETVMLASIRMACRLFEARCRELQREAALQESERRFRLIAENTSDGIMVFENGRISYTSPAYNRILGYSEKEELGRSEAEIADCLHPDEREEKIAAIHRAINNREESLTYTFRAKRSDGSWIWREDHARFIYDEQGNNTATYVIARNITERKINEQRLQMMTNILALLNRRHPLPELIPEILREIKTGTGLEAVAIRVRQGEDYPYYAYSGFDPEFIKQENSLLQRDEKMNICRDADGNPSLECTCGLVLSGRTDPDNPLFTPGGSSWTNDSLPFLEVPEEQDPRYKPRNNCIHRGYRSVAIIPIKNDTGIVGLLQLNDHRKNRFSLELVQFFESVCRAIGIAVEQLQD